jgi:hypothetical protein
MENGGGSLTIGEGQFSSVKDGNTAPQILPSGPGLHLQDLPFLLGVNGGPWRSRRMHGTKRCPRGRVSISSCSSSFSFDVLNTLFS